MKVLPAVIIALGLLAAPALWFGLSYLFKEQGYGSGAVDSEARIEIELLRQQVEDTQLKLDDLQKELSSLANNNRSVAPSANLQDEEDSLLRQTGPNAILDSYAQVVLIADRRNVNDGLKVAGGTYLSEKLGRPREDLTDDCQPMTNARLKEKLVLEQVGPIRVRMLAPAIESLKVVFDNIQKADPDLYERINTAGSLCVRRIRGTQNSLSTHSYGLAVDLNIDGRLDTLGDGKTQLGLTILADFFKDEGWVWGAGFGREDSMHFEISRRQLDLWLAEGRL
ncbi:M15 family metallopeptidase [Epibacterium sp. MM17-32]|uniref:M15 family metallopeptidase n=1 Tax=Epibacterium sp. MM17-32 TaxID=2917734 RepID=UPI001EF3EE27|nr:M15 family metallopeptidase [Epibacterium sp. MM17-32]MCG7629338.1 M15 family metallopeptidase [Epibacterium sp. MM17-32]